MKIVLTGFMGAGKSTVGKILANRMLLPFTDIDDEILRIAQAPSIPHIFSERGEEVFRRYEQEAIESCKGIKTGIFAPGGGVIENPTLLTTLSGSNGVIVYLENSFETSRKRVGGDPLRPLFQDITKAQERFERRLPLYRAAAQVSVVVDTRSPEEVADEVMKAVHAELFRRSNEQQLLCVIGDPITHSRSPVIHTAALREKGIDQYFSYVARQVTSSELSSFLSAAPLYKIKGMSVTMPLKEELFPYLSKLSEAASSVGAINTLLCHSEQIIGDNTDWEGIRQPLLARASLKGEKIGVLGAGGAARAAVYASRHLGAEPILFSRRAPSDAELSSCEWIPWEELKKVSACAALINTTPIGMNSPEESPLQTAWIQPHQVVFDTVYSPRSTALLQQAALQGAQCIEGLEMLVAQAAVQFERFTGVSSPTSCMRSTVGLPL